jgi:hypothetical protein
MTIEIAAGCYRFTFARPWAARCAFIRSIHHQGVTPDMSEDSIIAIITAIIGSEALGGLVACGVQRAD